MKLKLLFLKFYDAYCLVMDNRRNPLRHIHDTYSRFIITMVLAWLWCLTFGLYMGSIYITGLSFIAHFALLFMVFLTAAVFYDADKRHDEWLVELREIAKHHH